MLFDEALAEEKDSGAITRAFAMHRKTGKRFPVPAHILELLPSCRSLEKPALPKSEGKITPGVAEEMLAKILAGLKGKPFGEIFKNLTKG